MKFLTFVEVDLRKIIPFLIGLYTFAILGFQGMFYNALADMKSELIKGAMNSNIQMDEYVKTIDKISLASLLDAQPYPVLIVAFIGMALILTGFYLWYKEWFGASKRIYTLLSIRGSRMRIFSSKLVTFLFVFIAYYGVLLLNLYVASLMMNIILPNGVVADNLLQNTILHSFFVSLIIPDSIASLFFHLAFIIMIFAILSVFVLLDRSKRIWGLILGVLYIIASISVFIYINTLDLYTDERLYMNWAFVGVFMFISTIISSYLINKKVSI